VHFGRLNVIRKKNTNMKHSIKLLVSESVYGCFWFWFFITLLSLIMGVWRTEVLYGVGFVLVLGFLARARLFLFIRKATTRPSVSKEALPGASRKGFLSEFAYGCFWFGLFGVLIYSVIGVWEGALMFVPVAVVFGFFVRRRLSNIFRDTEGIPVPWESSKFTGSPNVSAGDFQIGLPDKLVPPSSIPPKTMSTEFVSFDNASTKDFQIGPPDKLAPPALTSPKTMADVAPLHPQMSDIPPNVVVDEPRYNLFEDTAGVTKTDEETQAESIPESMSDSTGELFEEIGASEASEPGAETFIGRELALGGNTGVIYLLKSGEHYKIGMTRGTVENRVKRLQTGSPYPIEIVHTIKVDNPREWEAYLHELYKHKRHYGEWYALDAKDVMLIKHLGPIAESINNDVSAPQIESISSPRKVSLASVPKASSSEIHYVHLEGRGMCQALWTTRHEKLLSNTCG
jgi:hypothetical protein